jgi:hypothetical protein
MTFGEKFELYATKAIILKSFFRENVHISSYVAHCTQKSGHEPFKRRNFVYCISMADCSQRLA